MSLLLDLDAPRGRRHGLGIIATTIARSIVVVPIIDGRAANPANQSVNAHEIARQWQHRIDLRIHLGMEAVHGHSKVQRSRDVCVESVDVTIGGGSGRTLKVGSEFG